MRLPPGLDILEEREGSGPLAEAGSTVVYNLRIFLNRGDEVPMNPSNPDATGEGIRHVDGMAFADHRATLGRRQAIAGIDKALVGMRAGGWRRIRVGAHLAYGSRGVEDRIPPDAVLTIELWLRDIVVRR
jgi:FKBP-type peptidyl-prolyl cis-trans isomerase (trigger factor)